MSRVDRAALRRKVSISTTHENADTSYRDAYDNGKTADDRRSIAWIEEQLFGGNPWAWCDVTVTVKLHGFSGFASLGQCSYESKSAFQSGDYYEDLVSEAVEELAATFEKIASDHDIWEHDRVTCILCASISE